MTIYDQKLEEFKNELKQYLRSVTDVNLYYRIIKINIKLQQDVDRMNLYDFLVKDEGGWLRIYFHFRKGGQPVWLDDILTQRRNKLERILK